MSSGRGDDLNSEINVTPMVDVMLVLLIIFMVTAGMLNTGVELDLPDVTAQNLEDPQGPLVMTIEKNNTIRLGGAKVTWLELEDKLKNNEKIKQEGKLFIGADNELPYGVVVTAMAVARNAGVPKVMMLTEPSENLKPRLGELDQIAKP